MPNHTSDSSESLLLSTAIGQISPERMVDLIRGTGNPAITAVGLIGPVFAQGRSDAELAPYCARLLKLASSPANGAFFESVVERMDALGRQPLLIACAYESSREMGRRVVAALGRKGITEPILRMFVSCVPQKNRGTASGGSRPMLYSFHIPSPKDLWDDAKKAVEAMGDAAVSIADAVAGFIEDLVDFTEDLVSIMAQVANWTVDQLAQLTIALIDAGKTAGEMLSAALALSEAMLRNMVKALVMAQGQLGAIASWLATNIPWVGPTIGALLEAAVAPLAIIEAVLAAGAAVLEATKALIDALGRMAELMERIALGAADLIKAEIKALLDLGFTLTEIVGELASAVISHVARGKFLQALMDLGHAALDILKAAAMFGLTQATLVFAGFVTLWGGRRMTSEELKWGIRVYGFWTKLLDTWLVVGSLPAEIVGYCEDNRPFTTLATIVFPDGTSLTDAKLIHELMHVHQNETMGPIYMAHSVTEQISVGSDAAYQYRLGARPTLEAYGIEQQAHLVEAYYETTLVSG